MKVVVWEMQTIKRTLIFTTASLALYFTLNKSIDAILDSNLKHFHTCLFTLTRKLKQALKSLKFIPESHSKNLMISISNAINSVSTCFGHTLSPALSPEDLNIAFNNLEDLFNETYLPNLISNLEAKLSNNILSWLFKAASIRKQLVHHSSIINLHTTLIQNAQSQDLKIKPVVSSSSNHHRTICFLQNQLDEINIKLVLALEDQNVIPSILFDLESLVLQVQRLIDSRKPKDALDAVISVQEKENVLQISDTFTCEQFNLVDEGYIFPDTLQEVIYEGEIQHLVCKKEESAKKSQSSSFDEYILIQELKKVLKTRRSKS